MYRRIDFRREKHGIPAKVGTIEYDPNRNARIALLTYAGDHNDTLFGTDYTCAPKAPGYRCSANGRLDLVFVFSERSQCEAERKRLIDAEEE